MKRVLAVLAVVALAVSPVFAGGECCPATAKASEKAPAKVAANEITLKGKIAKIEVEAKAAFVLATADGMKVNLPALTKEQEILDVEVEVVAKAEQSMDKDGKKVISVTEIVSVKKVEVAKEAAPAPAAPEAQ